MSTERPQGWYPAPDEPEDSMLMRWWTGESWTTDTYQRTDGPWLGLSTPTQTAPGDSTPARPLPQHSWPDVPQKAESTTQSPIAPALPDDVVVAGWWRRAVARIIDSMVVWVVTVTVGSRQAEVIDNAMTAAAQRGQLVSMTDSQVYRATVILTAIWVLLVLAYDMVFLLWRGATPGKALLRLRVHPAQPAARLTGWIVVRRWLAFQVAYQVTIIGAVYAVLDLCAPLRDRRRRTLHDRFAGTLVVRHSARPSRFLGR
ncbi:MAG: RDD family protein [Actinomycetota bacterium]